jgi:hypothetical protein
VGRPKLVKILWPVTGQPFSTVMDAVRSNREEGDGTIVLVLERDDMREGSSRSSTSNAGSSSSSSSGASAVAAAAAASAGSSSSSSRCEDGATAAEGSGQADGDGSKASEGGVFDPRLFE